MTDPAHRYRLFGLSVASEIPLPELVADPGAGTADVEVRVRTIADAPDAPAGLHVEGAEALLVIPAVGRFLTRAGREMLIEPAPNVSPRNLRLYLLGSAFAAILHQRGLLPLHANAVVVEGRAIGFMGHPGAGKSTLAAWFHDRGFDVLADDVCVVTGGADKAPLAHPGIPRLRLWREALEAGGRDASAYERSFDDMDKYTVPTDLERALPAVPLSHLYLLEKADGEPSVTRLEGSAAVEAMIANTYRGAYVRLMGLTRQHLLACAELARTVPVFRARRRWGYEAFDVEGAALEAHARELIRSGGTGSG
ncbi:MAG TPA: hypothetical protein VFQ67_13640 [Allosphingosinicella sp.]|nr:hypothetical protein [Allosphingosinicella sp.]